MLGPFDIEAEGKKRYRDDADLFSHTGHSCNRILLPHVTWGSCLLRRLRGYRSSFVLTAPAIQRRPISDSPIFLASRGLHVTHYLTKFFVQNSISPHKNDGSFWFLHNFYHETPIHQIFSSSCRQNFFDIFLIETNSKIELFVALLKILGQKLIVLLRTQVS